MFKSTGLALGITRTYIAGSSCGILQRYPHQDAGPPLSSCQYQTAVWKDVFFPNSQRFDMFSFCCSLSLLLNLLRMREEDMGGGGEIQGRASKGKLKKETQCRRVPVPMDLPGYSLPNHLPSARYMSVLTHICP